MRTTQEFSGWNAKGSINIPLLDLNTRLNELLGEKVILVCRSGPRAGSALSLLSKNNVEAVNAGAWQTMA